MKKLQILTFVALLALPGLLFAQRGTSQPSKAAANYQLTIAVNPGNAAIFIDGAQIKGNVATVTPGNHSVTTKAPGYVDFQTTVNVAGAMTLPISMQASSAQLTVSVNPSSAAIFIDGAQIKGNVASVTPGNHTVRTQASGYTDFQTTLNVTGNVVLPVTMAAIVVIKVPAPLSLGLAVAAYEKGIGRVEGSERAFVGTKGQTRPLQDFSVAFRNRNATLSIKYMAHISNVGDTGPVQEGAMFGYAGKQNIEGFSIELTGPDAPLYNIFYTAHVQNVGDTAVAKNGEYCGTRGQSLAVEGITVWVEKK